MVSVQLVVIALVQHWLGLLTTAPYGMVSEYAVLGPSANLAARLMGNKNNPGILVGTSLFPLMPPSMPCAPWLMLPFSRVQHSTYGISEVCIQCSASGQS